MRGWGEGGRGKEWGWKEEGVPQSDDSQKPFSFSSNQKIGKSITKLTKSSPSICSEWSCAYNTSPSLFMYKIDLLSPFLSFLPY